MRAAKSASLAALVTLQVAFGDDKVTSKKSVIFSISIKKIG